MSHRRKPPANLAAVKKSRSCLNGAITKAADNLKAIKYDDPAEVKLINTKDLDRILISVEKTETGFIQSIDEAQDFAPEGDEEEGFQLEEQTDIIVANRPDSGGTVPTTFLLSRSCPDKTSQNLH